MQIKILSLNIFEDKLLNNTLEFLKRENADIYCLQEVFNGSDPSLSKAFKSLEELKKTFPEYHVFYSPEMLCVTEEGKVNIGNAILSRFPLTSTTTHFFKVQYGEFPQVAVDGDWSKHPCNLQEASIDANGTNLNVFNIHGVWGFNGADNSDRLYMSEVTVNAIKGKTKVLLMGDTNVRPDTQTIVKIEQHLTSVFKGQLTTSFNLKHKDLEKSPGYATAVVDMLFVSKDIKILSKRVPQDDVSDHLPLVCEVEI